jgi:hypothetical protein
LPVGETLPFTVEAVLHETALGPGNEYLNVVLVLAVVRQTLVLSLPRALPSQRGLVSIARSSHAPVVVQTQAHSLASLYPV